MNIFRAFWGLAMLFGFSIGIGQQSVVASGSVRTVALSGSQPPGTESGLSFTSFSVPTINNSGQVAFRGHVGPTSTGRAGIWSEVNGSLSLIAREDEQVPNMPAGVSYGSLRNNPVINDNGHVAFGANLNEGGEITSLNDLGLWSSASGTLDLVAREGFQAPGTPSGVVFQRFTFTNAGVDEFLVLNSAGRMAFRGFLRTGLGGVTGDNDEGIWTNASGTLELVAREGSQAPGTPAGTLFDDTFRGANYGFRGGPVLNAVGQVAFTGSLSSNDGSVDSSNDYGIWTGEPGFLDLIAREGSPAPGIVGAIFDSVGSDPVLNNAGEVAFYAQMDNDGSLGINSSNSRGIWATRNGALDLVVRAGTPAPGAAPGEDFVTFEDPVINSKGDTAFYATLTKPDGPGYGRSGLWAETDGVLSMIARLGSYAPGTDGAVFEYFHGTTSSGGDGRPLMNSAGQVAFRAQLRDEVGDAIQHFNDFGIWAQDPEGNLQLVIREQDQIEVAPGDMRTVSYLSFANSTGNEDGVARGFNDLGQLAFEARFTDGTEGIFVSNVVSSVTPELLGDFDSDEDVDGADFLAWQRNPSIGNLANWQYYYGASSSSAQASSTTVPEPNTVLLLLICLACFSYRRNV